MSYDETTTPLARRKKPENLARAPRALGRKVPSAVVLRARRLSLRRASGTRWGTCLNLFDRDARSTWQRRIAPFKIALASWRLSPDPRIKVRAKRARRSRGGRAADPTGSSDYDLTAGRASKLPPGKPVRTVREIETVDDVEMCHRLHHSLGKDGRR